MNNLSKTLILTLISISLSVPASLQTVNKASAQTNVSVKVLTGLANSSSGIAYDVNNNGEVVGVSMVNGTDRPVLWSASGSATDLGVPSDISSGAIARSITDNGYIVGSTGYLFDGSDGIAIMFRPGTPTMLPGLISGRPANAWAVNNSGVSVGEARNNTLSRRFEAAVRWENGSVQSLGKLPTWDLALARGINDNGDVVGIGKAVLWESFGVAFLWRNGQFTELPSLGLSHGYSIAHAINNAGDIVGSSRRSDDIVRAALWRNGQVVDLGTMPGGTMSEAYAVNSVGDASGYVMAADSRTYAALFKNGQVVVLPNPPNTLQSQSIAYGMNDLGQIVGQAIDAVTFATIPVLWTVSDTVVTPPPPPTEHKLRSTDISLSAKNYVTIITVNGNVTVKNENNTAVSGAVVSVEWTRPGGSTVNQLKTTNTSGVAKFSTSGRRGTYKLTVKNIQKAGYVFDIANSVLSKSITK